MQKISKKWQKVILWAGAYASSIIFALLGGYVWLKTEDDELKKETKKVFAVTLVFLLLGAFTVIFSACMNMAPYNAQAYKAYYIINGIIGIAKILTFLIFGLFAYFNLKSVKTDGEEEKKEEVIAVCEESESKTGEEKNETADNKKE